MAGDTIEVDAGEYVGDVATWTKRNISLRAVGGRVRLIANGAAAEGKAIWVVRAANFSVDGFDFSGASVPDRNGAGIRFEAGSLIVRNCRFLQNENGILAGNNQDAELAIENSEFGHNGFGDGYSHNLYVGTMARLTVTGSYFHHARVGHLFKSRAAVNHILYNRLTDGSDGRASYEMEVPAGGVAYVIGNIIQQGPHTANPHLVSFGVEGYRWRVNELYLVNNTLVDDLAQGGRFLRVQPGAGVVRAINNILVGGSVESFAPAESVNNFAVSRAELENAEVSDYRLKRSSGLIGRSIHPGSANGQTLVPHSEYVHPQQLRPLGSATGVPGALQPLE